MKKIWGALALAAVAGCSPAPDNGATPAPTPLTTTAPVVTMPSPDEMPVAYRGRWALTPADCYPARSDAKGLMTIEAATIRFYEARAAVEKISAASPAAVTAELAFSGEGRTWHETTPFALAGDVLTREASQPKQTLTYRRCPA